MVVEGDELVVDWTGTDKQVRRPINATYGVTAGAVFNALFHVTDSNIPKNTGAYRPINVIAPRTNHKVLRFLPALVIDDALL